MISSAYLNYNRQNLFFFFFAFVSDDVLLFIGSIIDLQYCVSFRCTTKRFSCLNQIVFHYRLFKILNIVLCIIHNGAFQVFQR